ncbi:MAG TPA: molybdenum cofactor guanylyltransferase [Geobacteraceae bacterium]|nr:molybdenum cofactor guanylyltransferase [Geobacteraceae bacterium]
MDSSGIDKQHRTSHLFDQETKISTVTGVILAGGNSSRMKSNKALLPYRGELFIERIHRKLSGIFRDVLLVTNTPESYRFLRCPTVPDVYPAMGSLAGIHAGLSSCKTPYVFVTACDMPHLNTSLIRRLVGGINCQDVIIPESDGGLEPLHAVYGKGALPIMENALSRGNRKIVECCAKLNATVISKEEVALFDPDFLSFANINTPEDYYRFREEIVIGREDTLSIQGGMPK